MQWRYLLRLCALQLRAYASHIKHCLDGAQSGHKSDAHKMPFTTILPTRHALQLVQLEECQMKGSSS